MKLLIFEGSGKIATLKSLMASGKIPKMDFTFTNGHFYKISWKKDWKKEGMWINFDTFRPEYAVDSWKEDMLERLREKIEKADEVVIFTDNDFEWEVIAFSIYDYFKEHVHKFKRWTTPEISEHGLKKAFENLKDDYNHDVADAWIIRAVLDRIIGWWYSSIVYKKSNGLEDVSAWRCQSPSLGFLVEREREIRAFVPRDYYSIHADHGGFKSDHILNKTKDENEDLVFNETDAKSMFEKLSTVDKGSIIDYVESAYRTAPKPPYNGTSFQSDCSSILNIWLKEATEISQKLYEGGYVTYIRTDAIVLEDEKNDSIRDFVSQNYGGNKIPNSPIIYKNPESAQAWHMGICPVDVNLTPDKIAEELDSKSAKVYELIWKRAVASQMSPSEYVKQVITIDIAWEKFLYSAANRVEDGFLAVWNYSVDEEESEEDGWKWISDITIGSNINVKKIINTPHKTKPKARYTEAKCIVKMEALRIWRPSTFEPLLNKLKEKRYISVRNKKIYVEEKGEQVADIIESFAKKDIMDYSFTKKMEDLRDGVAKWTTKYLDLAREFFKGIKETLDENGVFIDENWFVKSVGSWQKAEATWHTCPICKKGNLMRKNTSKGEIISCDQSTYKDGKAWGCKYFNFIGLAEKTWEECPLCKGELIITTTKTGLKFKKCEFSVYDSVEKKNIWCWFKAIKMN